MNMRIWIKNHAVPQGSVVQVHDENMPYSMIE